MHDLYYKMEQPPIFCSGDVLHVYNSPAELVNLLIKVMPKIHSVAGNHDLPNHSYDQIKRSAYWTLVEAGRIINLSHPQKLGQRVGNIRAFGFPHGADLKPPAQTHDDEISLAVVHHYCWKEGHAHPGAHPGDHVDEIAKQLKGYDVVLIGDNHSPFKHRPDDESLPLIYGNGGFMRRRSDEKDHKPSVGILYSDKTIKRHYLDVSADKFIEVPDTMGLEKYGIDHEAFFEVLRDLGDVVLNYRENVIAWLRSNKVGRKVQNIVIDCLEGIEDVSTDSGRIHRPPEEAR